ncbi:MAG: phage terminase large subunit [Desulfovibrionaceae bacterium]|nr:phage terminase large subunit [Desulfovibrionaceae bacterium]
MVLRLDDFFLAHGAATHERRELKPFHRVITGACEQWVSGSLPGERRNLAVCMPPRHGKTYIARDLISWALGLFSDSEWIYTSSSATLATAQTIAIKNAVSSDWYHKIYPHVGVLPGKGRQDYFTTPKGGSVYAVGVGGTITGFGAGKKRPGFGGGIVIDDPLQAQDAYSQAKREGCNTWYTQTLYSRRNSDDTPVLLIMQRLHEQDLVGYLLEHEPEMWHVLQIPVRDDSGNVLWPETFSEESANRLQQIDPFAFSAQYMQSPTPAGGAMFQRDKLHIIDAMPQGLVRCAIFVDSAMKEGEYNDYSVLTYAATDGQNCYILDIDRGRWSAPVLLDHAISFWDKHKPHRIHNSTRFLGLHIEDKSSGTGLIQTLRAQTAIPVIPVQRSRDKVSRVNDILPYVFSDRLHILRAPWTDALVSELCSFSPLMTHEHDDQVDTITDAIAVLLAPQGGLLAGADWS